ncbi:MAG: RNA polymerase sigma-70 factor [Bacteroidota bacterium]
MSKQEFEALFREYFKPLTAFAKKYLNDIDVAKEIVHEAFLKLWEKREEVDTSKSVKSYLYTTVYNRSLNYIRDNKKFDRTEGKTELLEQSENWDQTNNMTATEIEAKITQTLDYLPEKCRQIFVMSRYEEMKYREIAKKLDISIKTVETQMSKALKALRKNLSEYITVLLFVIGNW